MTTRLLNHIGFYGQTGLDGILQRRRILTFLVVTLVELFIIPSNLLGWSGRSGVLFTAMSVVQLAGVTVVEIAFWTRRMNVARALAIILSIIYGRLTAEVIAAQFAVDFFTAEMVFGNFMMCTAAIIFSIIARLRYLPVVMGGLMPVVYIVCATIGNDESLFRSAWFFGVMMVSVLLLTFVNYLQTKAHDTLRADIPDDTTLNGLCLTSIKGPADGTDGADPDGVSHEERKTIDILSSDPGLPPEKTDGLFGRLSPERQYHIIKNVERYIFDDKAKKAALLTACPQLTESEFEICWLIVQGKSLKEMCAMLKKNESNITSQRSHIRRKLGLQRKDSLKMFLDKLINDQIDGK